MKTLIVTGGIATGKSTSIRLLMEKGGPRLRLFDCDAEAGRLLDGGRLRERLSRAFGPASVDEDGHADRNFLRELVFRNPESRRTLEGIIHPLLHQECLAQMRAARQNAAVTGFVIDVPLFLKHRHATTRMPCAWWPFPGKRRRPAWLSGTDSVRT